MAATAVIIVRRRRRRRHCHNFVVYWQWHSNAFKLRTFVQQLLAIVGVQNVATNSSTIGIAMSRLAAAQRHQEKKARWAILLYVIYILIKKPSTRNVCVGTLAEQPVTVRRSSRWVYHYKYSYFILLLPALLLHFARKSEESHHKSLAFSLSLILFINFISIQCVARLATEAFTPFRDLLLLITYLHIYTYTHIGMHSFNRLVKHCSLQGLKHPLLFIFFVRLVIFK